MINMTEHDPVQHYDRETGQLSSHPYGDQSCTWVDPQLGPCPTWPPLEGEPTQRITFSPVGQATEQDPPTAETRAERAAAQYRCWVCGMLPELHETTTLNQATPTYVAGAWPAPADDHEHASHQPTPQELEDAGHAALRRVLEA